MKTHIWFRSCECEEWRKVFGLTNLPEDWAHTIADRYNQKYSHGMWWVSDSKPDKSQVVENWNKGKIK